MKQIRRYIKKATALAIQSPSRYKLGAVVVNKKRIVGMGYNMMKKTHPTMIKFADRSRDNIGLHAEVKACLSTPYLKRMGADVIVVRIKSNGTLAMAKPCEICHRILKHNGIKKVYYSTDTHIDFMEV